MIVLNTHNKLCLCSLSVFSHSSHDIIITIFDQDIQNDSRNKSTQKIVKN